MDEVRIKLKNGDLRTYRKGIKPLDVLEDLKIDGKVIGAVFNGELWDLMRPIEEDGELEFVDLNDSRAPNFYRHTMAHIMAQAVMRIFGENKVRLGIGPVIENGFYYDFEILDGSIKEEDLPKIEEEMYKIVKENLPIERIVVKRDEAIKIMKEKGQIYKVELLEEMDDEEVTLYKQGEFLDLCRGPHLPSTGIVKHFKLLSVSGAYWRGDEKNPMLQRIYGTAFAKEEDLKNYLRMLEEASKRDHRKLGPKLDLFILEPSVTPGMPFFLPKGTIIMNELMRFSRELHIERGYMEVITPLIMNEALWRRSGHWDHFKDNMYFTQKEDVNFAVKPMNCPGHIIIFKRKPVSYRDLPMRIFEFGKVHRYERSGVLHGLLRVRAFTQDDAHVFCTEEQIEEEVKGIIDLIDTIYEQFGFTYRAELCTMPEDHMGDEETWNKATEALKNALDKIGLDYRISEGEGAFYGPKIDFHVKDSIGREWQCATVQLDFLMPERFDVNYIGPDGKEKRVVMIHRAIYGSLERFFGILIEHYAGAFPTWLSPVQVVVIPI
ncbi:MAG: threonine--tRNA ligase, partial [Thermotoga sp.]